MYYSIIINVHFQCVSKTHNDNILLLFILFIRNRIHLYLNWLWMFMYVCVWKSQCCHTPNRYKLRSINTHRYSFIRFGKFKLNLYQWWNTNTNKHYHHHHHHNRIELNWFTCLVHWIRFIYMTLLFGFSFSISLLYYLFLWRVPYILYYNRLFWHFFSSFLLLFSIVVVHIFFSGFAI